MTIRYAHPFPAPTGYDAGDGFGATAGRVRAHRGIDYAQPAGAAIRAIADGTVVVNQWSADLGNVLGLRLADGMFAGLAHLIRKPTLVIGASVSCAVTLGGGVGVGQTGAAAFGNHLHLSLGSTQGAIFGEGYGSTLVDPYAYIQARLSGATTEEADVRIIQDKKTLKYYRLGETSALELSPTVAAQEATVWMGGRALALEHAVVVQALADVAAVRATLAGGTGASADAIAAAVEAKLADEFKAIPDAVVAEIAD